MYFLWMRSIGLNRQVEEVLYPAMEDYAIDIMIGKGATARSIRSGSSQIYTGRSNDKSGYADSAASGPLSA